MSFYYLLTASFNLDPALNVTLVLAAILTTSPVLGFLPFLAALFEVPKVPKPVNAILSPFFNVYATALMNASSARDESALVNPDFAAIASINSNFVIIITSV